MKLSDILRGRIQQEKKAAFNEWSIRYAGADEKTRFKMLMKAAGEDAKQYPPINFNCLLFAHPRYGPMHDFRGIKFDGRWDAMGTPVTVADAVQNAVAKELTQLGLPFEWEPKTETQEP